MVKKILFICRHNRFRSKVAEAYFNKINKNENVECRGAGIFPGSYPLDKIQVKVAKSLGIAMKGKPQPITSALLKWNDVIIAITDDLPKGLFKYGPYNPKVVEWKISDVSTGKDIEGNEIRIRKIMKKVEALVKKLENQK